MGFTTQVFVFVFFPLSVAGVGLCRLLERRFLCLRGLRLADWTLAGGSLLFYGFALFDGMYRLFFYALAVWAAGRVVQAFRVRRLALPVFQENEHGAAVYRWVPWRVVAVWAAVLMALGVLFRFKYWNFSVPLWNAVFQGNFQPVSLAVPLGISFITFSAISYLVDVGRGFAPAGSFLDCLLYLSFFPKVVSGPIVLWREFLPQISGRRTGLEDAAAGVERMVLGFVKKLVLADMFGVCIAEIDRAAASEGVDCPTAWFAVLLYMLQIYYDFAGYSDIAIGLGRLFGFSFQENFEFPYRSCSITEFWRRWHISLGRWFREYVYIPLGGSRRGLGRTLWNLAVVFALTGIWHGAGWNYLLWGGINGFFVLLERVVWEKRWYRKIPNLVKWAGTMLVVLLFWELFRFQSVRELGRWLALMLGLVRYDGVVFSWRYFLDARMMFLTAAGVFGAVAFGGKRVPAAWARICGTLPGGVFRTAGVLVLFVLALLCMVSSGYSPFIYFQY